MDHQQTRSYILSRLERAGAAPQPPIFSPEALDKIYEYSRGIPRIINTLCENCMVNAFAREQRPVQPEIVTEVATDFRLTPPSLPEETSVPVTAREENGESLLRSLFRLLRTMDNQTLEAEKPLHNHCRQESLTMSRVFEALQKSQAENPSASPLAQGQPESAPGERLPTRRRRCG